MDDTIKSIGKIIDLADSMFTNESEYGVRLVHAAEELLRNSTKGKNLNITSKLHEPFRHMGYVAVEGEEIKFDPQVFVAISKRAVNVEAYPMTNGKVRINFTFNNLTE